MHYLGEASMRANMQRLRELRLAKEAQEAAERAHRKSAASFWDNIDSSGGPDACHPWTGERRWNHNDPNTARYEYGVFYYEGCNSYHAARVLCHATYGREPPQDMDVMPLCGDHLCCNLKHFAITPHGGNGDKRLNRAVPVEEYFSERETCDVVCVAVAA